MQLKILAAAVMSGALAACGDAPPAAQVDEVGSVEAVQKVAPWANAVEFTPKTAPHMTCVAIASSSDTTSHLGGVDCFPKVPTAP